MQPHSLFLLPKHFPESALCSDPASERVGFFSNPATGSLAEPVEKLGFRVVPIPPSFCSRGKLPPAFVLDALLTPDEAARVLRVLVGSESLRSRSSPDRNPTRSFSGLSSGCEGEGGAAQVYGPPSALYISSSSKVISAPRPF